MFLVDSLPLRKAGRRAAFASLVIPAALLAGCSRKAPSPHPPAPPQVGVITVTPQPVVRTTELPGRTSAVAISEVRPQVNGVILKRLFTEGSDVKEGQQLYQIDPSIYQAAYDTAVATLAHDEAEVMSADALVARDKPLVAAQAVSEQDYDDAVAAANEAKADVATARAAIELAHTNLEYTKVLAPISGTISQSVETEGALVTAGQAAPLATVTQLDPIYVDVNEPTSEWLRLKREMDAGQLETTGNGGVKIKLELDDGSTYPLAGKPEFTDVDVDESTGTVLVRAIFPNPQHLLLPGMYVHAEIEEGIDLDGILVPQQAVSHNTHGDATVLVVGKDNVATLRIIQTGPAINGDWVVTGGLQPGERVVVDGLQNVQVGSAVTPVPEDGTRLASSTAP